MCLDTADANNDDIIDISDVISIVLYQFSGGSAPPAPFPNCGVETSGGISIGCNNYPGC